jgi:hypothetical protein
MHNQWCGFYTDKNEIIHCSQVLHEFWIVMSAQSIRLCANVYFGQNGMLSAHSVHAPVIAQDFWA